METFRRVILIAVCAVLLLPAISHAVDPASSASDATKRMPVPAARGKTVVINEAAPDPAMPPSVAASSDQPAAKVPVAEKPATTKSKNILWRSDSETFLSSIVLIFGCLLFVAELVVIKVGNYNPDQSTKLVAVTLIIVGTLFIITAGFSSEQIAPAMGLFGTVAGYLLGRSQNESH